MWKKNVQKMKKEFERTEFEGDSRKRTKKQLNNEKKK